MDYDWILYLNDGETFKCTHNDFMYYFRDYQFRITKIERI